MRHSSLFLRLQTMAASLRSSSMSASIDLGGTVLLSAALTPAFATCTNKQLQCFKTAMAVGGAGPTLLVTPQM